MANRRLNSLSIASRAWSLGMRKLATKFAVARLLSRARSLKRRNSQGDKRCAASNADRHAGVTFCGVPPSERNSHAVQFSNVKSLALNATQMRLREHCLRVNLENWNVERVVEAEMLQEVI